MEDVSHRTFQSLFLQIHKYRSDASVRMSSLAWKRRNKNSRFLIAANKCVTLSSNWVENIYALSRGSRRSRVESSRSMGHILQLVSSIEDKSTVNSLQYDLTIHKRRDRRETSFQDESGDVFRTRRRIRKNHLCASHSGRGSCVEDTTTRFGPRNLWHN